MTTNGEPLRNVLIFQYFKSKIKYYIILNIYKKSSAFIKKYFDNCMASIV